MAIVRADVWCGHDQRVRDLMERRDLLVPKAPRLSDLTNGELRGKVIGGEAPPWSRLPSCAGVIERVPSPKDLTSKAWTAVNPVEGFAAYAIGTRPPLMALLTKVQIVAIVSALPETENATVRARLGLPSDTPVWSNPQKKHLLGEDIAVWGEVPLAVAMHPDSCTVALPSEAGPGDSELVTVTVSWQWFLREDFDA